MKHIKFTLIVYTVTIAKMCLPLHCRTLSLHPGVSKPDLRKNEYWMLELSHTAFLFSWIKTQNIQGEKQSD